MPSIKWNKRWARDVESFSEQRNKLPYYGTQWGDPDLSGIRYWIQKILRGKEVPGDLSKVIKEYIRPYVKEGSVVLEIGSGGGRWTKYLLPARQVIVVDLNPEFFPYLRERFKDSLPKFRFYQTTGYELDGIDTGSVDFVFTFGTFVHIDPDGIRPYLGHIERVLRSGGIAVIQYSDKTKRVARENPTFSDMNPTLMEEFVSDLMSLVWLDHNLHLLSHSNIAVLQKTHKQRALGLQASLHKPHGA